MALPPNLAHLAETVLSVNGKLIKLGNAAYVDQSDRASLSSFTITSSAVVAGQSQRAFSIAPGETGQGWTFAANDAMATDSEGDKFSGNEAYVVTHMGFQAFAATSAANEAMIGTYVSLTSGASLPLTSWDLLGVASCFSWSIVTGSGPERIMGRLLQWPANQAVYAGSASGSVGASAAFAAGPPALYSPDGMRELLEPIVFYPNVTTAIKLANGTASTTLSTGTNTLAIRSVAKGFRVTLPV